MLVMVASVTRLVGVLWDQHLLSGWLVAFCRFPCHQCLLSAQQCSATVTDGPCLGQGSHLGVDGDSRRGSFLSPGDEDQ